LRRMAAAHGEARRDRLMGMRRSKNVRTGPLGERIIKLAEIVRARAGLAEKEIYVSSGMDGFHGPRPFGSHHYGLHGADGSRSAAIDFGGYDDPENNLKDQRDMQAFARQWEKDLSKVTLELIHTTPFPDDNGFYIKEGRRTNYDKDTRDSHLNHIHIAMSEKQIIAAERRLRSASPRPAASPRAASNHAKSVRPTHRVGEKGLDYSFARPSPDAAWKAGYRFVMRYLSWLPNDKVVTKAEVSALLKRGFAVGLNWEYDEGDQLDGRAGGLRDGKEALRQARALGAPKGLTIYFSADWDVRRGEVAACKAYWKGAREALAGQYNVGVYGGFRAVAAALDAGYRAWQTFAWSGGKWDTRAHIRQVENEIKLNGASVDRNELRSLDAGLWGLGDVGPSDEEDVMLFGKVKGKAAVVKALYDHTYVDMKDWAAVKKVLDAGAGRLVEFDTKDQLEAALGTKAV
jgi:hypothetical protein